MSKLGNAIYAVKNCVIVAGTAAAMISFAQIIVRSEERRTERHERLRKARVLASQN